MITPSRAALLSEDSPVDHVPDRKFVESAAFAFRQVPDPDWRRAYRLCLAITPRCTIDATHSRDTPWLPDELGNPLSSSELPRDPTR